MIGKHFSIYVPGNATIVQRPSIWMIDLKTDTVLNRYEIPPPSSGSGFASITIDVIDCEQNSFAYLPDLLASQILVYSLRENRSYIVNHNFFHMHPFQGELSRKLMVLLRGICNFDVC
jgi:dopachrome tautomerase